MVFQSYALYPHMSVRQNLSFGLENFRMARDEINRRVDSAAALLQIDQLLDRRPGQLSGGSGSVWPSAGHRSRTGGVPV